MRLWHKDLIPVLPRQQLLSQWRECCCIARNIAVNGTPNHILVNKIMDYPIDHFIQYAFLVHIWMRFRGYDCDFSRFEKWMPKHNNVACADLFSDWHDDRYFIQCFHNLEEKYDCGGISDEEWEQVVKRKGCKDDQKNLCFQRDQ